MADYRFLVYSSERSHDQEHVADSSGKVIAPWHYASTAFYMIGAGPPVTSHFPDPIISTMQRLTTAMAIVDEYQLLCYFSWEVQWNAIDFYLVFEEAKDAIVFKMAASSDLYP